MIHFKEDDKLEMNGTGFDLLSESCIIAVHVIQSMIECGLTKDFAITKFYESLEQAIKIYESDGEL